LRHVLDDYWKAMKRSERTSFHDGIFGGFGCCACLISGYRDDCVQPAIEALDRV
jgi:hypothetical protein